MVDYRTSKTPPAHLAAASDESCQTAMDDSEIIERLRAAVLMENPSDMLCVRQFGKDIGVSSEQLADIYIPEVARRLGDQWCTDELGFAEVTIGSARLQAMLRDLSQEWDTSDAFLDVSTVLLCVPEGTYHTMGAMVLSGQLRRKGLSVRLLLGATPQNIRETFALVSFDAVFVSAVRGESLDSLRKIVDSAHSVSSSAAPVVIGGTLLDLEPDIAALTGADYVTNFADEAIALCNLRTKPRSNIASDS